MWHCIYILWIFALLLYAYFKIDNKTNACDDSFVIYRFIVWVRYVHESAMLSERVCVWALCMRTERFLKRREFVKHAILRRHYKINWASLSFYFCVHYLCLFFPDSDDALFYSNCFSVYSLACCGRFNFKNAFTDICWRKTVHTTLLLQYHWTSVCD